MIKFKRHFEAFGRPALVLGIAALLVLLAFKTGLVRPGEKLENLNSRKPAAEIAEIKATQDLGERVRLYTDLIKRVGPREAQVELLNSGLPFDGQTHLLNHAVGDYLYEKHGPKGLVECFDYFLSSCYHGFILHAIADGGMSKLEETFNECRKAGPAVSSQCAHAIGHGFLTNAGYKNLTKALLACDEAERTMVDFPAFNCYDGVFMENIWAVHEGEPSPDRWVDPQDLMYPCNDPRIDDKYILGCWSNQPSLVYQYSRGDVKKVAGVCAKVAESDHKRMCFDGLARQIHPVTEGQAQKVFELCGMMPDESWQNFCVNVNAGSSYAVGDRDVPFEVCADTQEANKPDCYGRVFSMMRAYAKPGENIKDLCRKIPDSSWRNQCDNMR